ncbi:hypothetical protein GCK72_020142 [Caenorhabditis remanei]|uniref:T20D4.11-like domain-containing protein n=1 Tax=Caenorhabditis remanei TaxID=31234 RepID=A0A6A5GFV1_CAERE|nr:hypothetical protein GCK72_020142 [Caenorhabditis remanei]KAF1753585.1 hypothetical protein GCK72_020142 [Caenorhabditis remanei]
MHQTCSPLVDELMFQIEQFVPDSIELDAARNLTRLCSDVMSCFGKTNCLEAQRNKETYTQKCQKLDFKNYGMHKCMPYFYKMAYNQENSCASKYDFFTNDLKTKRIAFTSGKQCLLEIVSVKCSKKTMAYLNDYYDNFVNILTTPPNNTRCTSAYDGLTSIQCMPILKKTSEIFTTTEDYSALNGLSAVKLCESARDCMKNSCVYSLKTVQNMDSACINFRKATFQQCYYSILTSTEDYSKYKCVKDIIAKNKTAKFTDDKACMKSVMTGECSNVSAEGFDAEWDNRSNFGQPL